MHGTNPIHQSLWLHELRRARREEIVTFEKKDETETDRPFHLDQQQYAILVSLRIVLKNFVANDASDYSSLIL